MCKVAISVYDVKNKTVKLCYNNFNLNVLTATEYPLSSQKFAKARTVSIRPHTLDVNMLAC